MSTAIGEGDIPWEAAMVIGRLLKFADSRVPASILNLQRYYSGAARSVPATAEPTEAGAWGVGAVLQKCVLDQGGKVDVKATAHALIAAFDIFDRRAPISPSPLGDADTLRKIMEQPESRSPTWLVEAILAAGFRTHRIALTLERTANGVSSASSASRWSTMHAQLLVVREMITCPNRCPDAHEGARIDPLTLPRAIVPKTRGGRHYPPLRCERCGGVFQPTGARSTCPHCGATR